jgi:signal transduction histidine kinase
MRINAALVIPRKGGHFSGESCENNYIMRGALLTGILIYALAAGSVLTVLSRQGLVNRGKQWGAPTPTVRDRYPVVNVVAPNGPATGILEIGDQIVAVEGKRGFVNSYGVGAPLFQYPPGTKYRVDFIRRGEAKYAILAIDGWPATIWQQLAFWSALLLSLAFMACGILMGWQRPELAAARAGWLASTLTALFFVGQASDFRTVMGWTENPIALIASLGDGWHLYATALFLSIFPGEGLNTNRTVKWLIRSLLAICLVYSALRSFLLWDVLTKGIPDNLKYITPSLNAVWASLQASFELWVPVVFTFIVVANYRRSGDDDRRRIEIVAFPILASVLVTLAVVSYGWLSHQSKSRAWEWQTNLAAFPVPFCFYYAVVRHQVFDIRLVARLGLQYLLAKQFLRFLTLAPLVAIGSVWILRPAAPITAFNFAGLFLMGIAGLGLEFRQHILEWCDRYFLREANDRTRMLRKLMGELSRLGSYAEIERTIVSRLDNMFQPEFVAIREGQPIHLAELTIPITGPQGQVEGQLVLGRRKSDERYSEQERELLKLIASHVGLVRENLLLAAARFDAVLTERARIARELHDTMSQGFAGISLFLEAAHKAMPESGGEALTYLDEARALAKASIREVRDSVRGLRASSEESMFEARLRSLAARRTPGLDVVLDLNDEACAHIPADVGWHLARVAEEAVANALKHSHATKIGISLKVRGEALVLSVEDDGRGFDPERTKDHGFGLIGMRERIDHVHGRFAIDSVVGRGTRLEAMVPNPGHRTIASPRDNAAGATA